MSIRFFHTADLHLESPFKGLYNIPQVVTDALRTSTFHAFEKLVEQALEDRPDFILIVGDIYDGENRSLTAQNRFVQQLKRLDAADIPVIVSYGNHDHLSGSWSRFELPKNVHEFGPTVEEFTFEIRQQKVIIHGFSYDKRHVTEPMIDYYRRNEDDALHIGMLHGSVEGDQEHNVYAPFSRQALLQKNYHYWALGHIHKRQILHDEPAIIYPGNTQGRHRKESGDKGFYDVTLADGQTTLNFVSTAVIRFETLTISVATSKYANELMQEIEQGLQQLNEACGAVIVELHLTDFSEEASAIYLKNGKNMWLEALRDQLDTFEPFIWLSDIKASLGRNNMEESELTKKVMQRTAMLTADQMSAPLAELFDQPKLAKYVQLFSAQQWEELQQEAQQLIVEQLQRGGRY
ncbi:metallophosphoesterase family protein [Kurthia sibirica]|uniref:DNA repair exonuclease n=1 Tax=Kurthia sibirica TaxID=202750 RepID=A0A2U3AJM1_9BACL|nr:DNA repair exonuclease [Kurthia sibirica]PWI24661.1 DNA repair exonuclease [Kurthia sibirica]GEK33493.1 DNA repair exonuclease [Kurthia sibirica]